VRGKEGFSLGTCSARASQASRPWAGTVNPPYYDMGYITILSILRSTPLDQAFFGVILR
jgi:hypothetical protein